MTYEVTVAGQQYRVELVRRGEALTVRVNGRDFPLDAAQPTADTLSLIIAGRVFEITRERSPEVSNGELQLAIGGQRYTAEVRDPRALRSRRARSASAAGPRAIKAPMPGKVVRVLAPAGTRVESGQGVLVIEAMKMQNELKSPKDGTVRQLLATEGAAVNAGDVLAVIE
jgi:biotin carboxyl carrier protein